MVKSNNSNASPMNLYGASIQGASFKNSPYLGSYYGEYRRQVEPSHPVTSITTSNQVVGLVPVFPCEDPECRNGKYGSNDTEFMLPVFAENQQEVWGDYKNDYNSFLFDLPSNSALTESIFYLDKKSNGAWSQIAELNDNTYGVFYPQGSLCTKNYFTGYGIFWNKVLALQGEGVYRFRMGTNTGSFTESVNHLKITGVKPNGSILLDTIGYGLICPAFSTDDGVSEVVNMQNLVIFINQYQALTYADPLFEAVYNSGTGQIDIFGLLGQNCPALIQVLNVTYINYAETFTGGENTLSQLGCFASVPFCLKTWSCYAVDLTTRFDVGYKGGVIGNVDKSLPGSSWSFCCSGRKVAYPDTTSLFTIGFWGQSQIYADSEFTFSMPYGYDLVPPITFTIGTTDSQMAQQLTLAINTYQATLTPPQFSAYYNPISDHCEITNLFGENVQVDISWTNYFPGNTIQIILNRLVGFFPITGVHPFTVRHASGKFFGGSEVDPDTTSGSVPISWKDAIRVGGEFGYEDTDFERKSIKYQTGVVKKVRDELILKHKWKSSSMPFWFHERFKAYGLMADQLLVSDYNLNNSDYNIKLYSVQGDSSYNPGYKGYPRETRVTCEFKPATQNLKRSRCC